MKIMWLCNILMSEFAKEINEKGFYGGGWMDSLAKDIAFKTDNILIICAPYNKNEITKKKIGNIIYYAFPKINMRKNLEFIYNEINPDIVHIHGTEFSHGYELMEVVPNAKYVVSIQGLISIYAKHFYANVPYKIINKKTLAQMLINDSIKNGKRDFEKRGIIEEKIIKNAKYIIGRTRWDKACVYNINKDAKYFYCGESLRDSFYNKKWNVEKNEAHSIFISQATYPIKGFHMFIYAFKDIIKNYPDSKVYVAGKNVIDENGLKNKMKKRYYDIYIKNLIYKFNLQNNIIFTGPLNENEMSNRMIKCNVVVSPSAIENSPNSIGEAMSIGVPVVASNVGGVSDLIKDQEEGFLYPFNEYYMMKYYIEKIFEDNDLAKRVSENERKKALKLYDRKENLNTIINIYKKIIEE